MSITFRQLHELRLGKLKKAVSDWKTMLDDLGKVAGEEGDSQGANAAGMAKKANAADWRGKNAVVTQKFVTKTAGEFKDVVATAKSVHTILNGLYSDMKKHKEDLRDVISHVHKDIHVTASGVVEPRDDADPKSTQKQIDAVVDDIERILKAAATTDKAAADALRHEAKDKYNFLSTRVTSFKDTKQAIKDADAFLKLGKHDPNELTNAQLTQLTTWMKRSEDDPLFAERVATGMGPKKALSFYAKAVDLDSWQPTGEGNRREALADRKKILGDLETHFGTTLASASNSESGAMESWKKSVIALGGEPVAGTSHHKPVYGFQAMSNLMRHGKYDGDFLNNYGDALVKYENAHTGDVKDPGPGGKHRKNVLPWDELPSYAQNSQLHFGDGSDKDAGLDPMTGFMKALARNPEASSDFFSSNEPQDNSEWVLHKRPTFNDVVADGYGESREDYHGKSAMWDATGDALFAGGTGLDPNDPQSATRDHTPEQKAVLENAIHDLAARKDNFPAELRDDMAKIFVNHGDQVHYSMSAQADDPTDPKLLPQDQLIEVSKQISRDQDAYGLLNDGLNREMIHDIHTDHPKDPRETLQRAGHTVGFLEEARYQALADQNAADKRDALWKQSWAYHGSATVTSLVPAGPLTGPVDRELYLLSQKWRLDEEDRINRVTHQQNGDTFDERRLQIKALAETWGRANPDSEMNGYTATTDANSAALLGSAYAQGKPGRQPAH